MAANLSSLDPNPTSRSASRSLILGCLGYTIEGTIIGIANLIIVLSILKYRALRHSKQYIIVMTLAFADALNCSGFLTAGVFRLRVIISGRFSTPIRAVDCLAAPHLWLLNFSQPLASFMLITVSSDRILQVYNPLYYMGLGHTYAIRLVSCSFVYIFSMAGLGMALVATREQLYVESALCMVYGGLYGKHDIVRIGYGYYVDNCPSVYSFASVLLYLLVLPIYKHRSGRVQPQTSAEQRAELQRQARMTHSLAISCAATFLLYCLPIRLGFYCLKKGVTAVAQVFFLVLPSNSFANLGIFLWRHQEMRTAVRGLFFGKQMPDSLDLWTKNKPTSSRHQSNKPALVPRAPTVF